VLLTPLTQNAGLSLKLSTLDTATSNSAVSLTQVLLAPEPLEAFIFFKKNNKSSSKDELYYLKPQRLEKGITFFLIQRCH
jgi:hypothetical protein